MSVLKFCKEHSLAKTPTRTTSNSAGFDLYSVEYCIVEPRSRALVNIGIKLELPPETYGRIAPRSGLSLNYGIDIGAGVIDQDYRGVIKVLVFNHSGDQFIINPGDRIAQLICERICCPILEESSSLDFTLRGSSGFGSSEVDFFMTLMTFFVGIFYSVEMSIVIGAIFNALVLLKAWSRPYIFVEIKSTGSNLSYIYVRPDLGLFYPAADYLTETIKKAHKKNPHIPIALDCSGILNIDYSAAKTIETLIKTYNQKHTGIVLLNVKESVIKRLGTVMESTNLKVCQSTEDIHSKSFGNRDIENPDEAPLLQYNMKLERRYSEKREDVRKGSLCDLE